MTRLSLFCLHLLVLWIHLSVCLPLFVCHHHLPAFAARVFRPFRCVCSSYSTVSYTCIPLRDKLFIRTRCFEKNWGDVDSNMDIFRKLRACLLTYLCGELPEPRHLDEVNSVRLETFYRCNTFRDVHYWWVHDERLHLRVTQINPCDYETTQEGDYGKADTDEHNCTSKQRLQCNQILRKQACTC